jgi:general secretion pathway protein L
MSKRFIGIERDGTVIRVVIVGEEKGVREILSLHQGSCEQSSELVTFLRETIGPERPGDQLVGALPAQQAFVRWLKFPFRDEKKIAEAIPLELSAQLPVAIEDYVVAFQKPRPEENGYRVVTAAVRAESIRNLLLPLDEKAILLQVLDLAPFAFTSIMPEPTSDGILITSTEQETTAALILGGQVNDYRLLTVHLAQPDESTLSRLLQRECSMLQKKSGREDLPIYLIGSQAGARLLTSLQEAGFPAEIPRFVSSGQPVAGAYLPALALALRAAVPGKDRRFNLRSGEFALKNEWAPLKIKLLTLALLLSLSGLAFATSAYIQYQQQARRLEALKQAMTDLYRQAVPDAKVIVDIPLQLQSHINELEKMGQTIGAGGSATPLDVLAEISRNIPAKVTVDIREFNYSPEEVRMDGSTTSFDAINQLQKGIETSELIREVQISDAKMSVDGSRVDFRLNLAIRKEQEIQ